MTNKQSSALEALAVLTLNELDEVLDEYARLYGTLRKVSSLGGAS